MYHINQVLKNQVSKYGERTVFKYKDKQSEKYLDISWNKLDETVTKVSKSLLQLGFGFDDKIARDDLFFGIGSQRVGPWQINESNLSAIPVNVTFLLLNCDTGIVTHILPGTGQDVEDARLARVRVAR